MVLLELPKSEVTERSDALSEVEVPKCRLSAILLLSPVPSADSPGLSNRDKSAFEIRDSVFIIQHSSSFNLESWISNLECWSFWLSRIEISSFDGIAVLPKCRLQEVLLRSPMPSTPLRLRSVCVSVTWIIESWKYYIRYSIFNIQHSTFLNINPEYRISNLESWSFWSSGNEISSFDPAFEIQYSIFIIQDFLLQQPHSIFGIP